MANTFRQENFRPTRGFGYVAIFLLAVIALCGVLDFVFSVGMIAFPDTALELDDGDSINVSLAGLGLLAIVDIPLRILCAIFFLVWLHRAHGNLSALKSRNLEFSPGWAVGWWFIPFLNLVRPFQIVRELYNESDPDLLDESGYAKVSSSTSELVGFWWASFLIAGFAFRVSDALYGKGDSPASNYFPVAYMVAGILSAVAAVLAITIIRNVNTRQELRALKVRGGAPEIDIPPPPPVFGGND